MMKFKRMFKYYSTTKVRNIAIGSFAFISSLMLVGGAVYLFIEKQENIEIYEEEKLQAYNECVNAGRLRNFQTEEKDNEILFFAPNLRNTPYSTMSAMIATANACHGFTLKQSEGACIGPGCEKDLGAGIPFYFTLVQTG